MEILQQVDQAGFFSLPLFSEKFLIIMSPSSLERLVAASTALIKVVRNPPLSRVAKPEMAVPPGEVTLSLSWPGCSWVSINSLAAPNTVWAANKIESCRERPILTPASAREGIFPLSLSRAGNPRYRVYSLTPIYHLSGSISGKLPDTIDRLPSLGNRIPL